MEVHYQKKKTRKDLAYRNLCRIKDKVEVIFEEEQTVLKPVSQARKGWNQAFKKSGK